MCHFFRAVVAIGILCLPQTSIAQDPRGIIDFFAREMQRQQYLQQQQQYQQQLYNEFLNQWNACFSNDLQACDQALYYPGLNQNDRARLWQKRQSIVATQEYEEQQRRSREMERLQEVERQRQAELERQRAEAERQRIEIERQRAAAEERTRRQREEEERRVAALRAFNYALDGCRRYVASSCDAALASQIATAQDRASIANWRAIAEKFQADLTACQGRSAAACDSALVSPAANASDRTTLERLRGEASPLYRARALAVEFSQTTAGTAQSLANTVRELPASTQITGAIAVLLAAALAFVILPRRADNQARLHARNDAAGDLSSMLPRSTREPDGTLTIAEVPQRQGTATGMDKPLAMAAIAAVSAQASDTLPQNTAVQVEQTDDRGAAGPEPSWAKETVLQGADHRRTGNVNPSATSGVSIASVLGHPALFALLYILLMIPTYFLPYAGSNSAVLNAAGSTAGIGMNPAFWAHLGVLALLIGVTWIRGNSIGKTWLIIFPILALVFDLTPGLNFIPLVPTVMHLMAIILGVSGGAAPSLTPQGAPGGR